MQCNRGINQEDYSCIEPSSAGADVNTKVCLYSLKICSSWNDKSPLWSGLGWCPSLSGLQRSMDGSCNLSLCKQFSSSGDDQPPWPGSQGGHQATHQTWSGNAKVLKLIPDRYCNLICVHRYPPADECARRRCVLGRCLEQGRLCDRVWDCQVTLFYFTDCQVCSSLIWQVHAAYLINYQFRTERMSVGASTPKWTQLAPMGRWLAKLRAFQERPLHQGCWLTSFLIWCNSIIGLHFL